MLLFERKCNFLTELKTRIVFLFISNVSLMCVFLYENLIFIIFFRSLFKFFFVRFVYVWVFFVMNAIFDVFATICVIVYTFNFVFHDIIL